MPTRRSTTTLLVVALLMIASAVGLQFAFGTPERITEWDMGDLRPSDPSREEGPSADLAAADRSELAEGSDAEPEWSDAEHGSPSRVLRGRVVDAGGTPVAGADVRLRVQVAGRTFNQGEVNRPVQTAGDGSFAFRGPLGGVRSVTVSASHPAYAPAAVEREIAGQGQDEVRLHDVILTAGGIVVGSVTSTDQVGIVDATVELTPNNGPGGGLLKGNLVARTVGGGGYRIEHVPAGSYRVVARAPRMLIVSSPMFGVREGDVTTVPPLALGEGCVLDGLVTDRQGQPIAGARIWVNPIRPGTVGTGESGSDGRFAIDNLARTEATLRVQKAGYVSHQGGIDLAARERVTVVLEAGLRITGTVRDAASGAALTEFAVQARRLRALTTRSVEPGAIEAELQARARGLDGDARAELEAKLSRLHEVRHNSALEAWRERLRSLPKDPGTLRSFPDGTFVCDGLDEGVWVVDIRAADHQLARSDTLELAVGKPDGTVDFALIRGHTVAGTVAGADGAAIAGALVELMLMPPPGTPAGASTHGVRVLTTTSSATGSFRLPNAPAGWISLAVTAKGHDAAQTPPFELATDVADVVVRLGARARIVGRVLGVSETEGAAVSVVAIAAFRNVTSKAADADGTFALDDLKPGPYHVRAYLCDGREATQRALASVSKRDAPPDLVLAAGETRSFDVQVQRIPVGKVTGHVRRNGAPAAGHAVRLSRQEGRIASPEPTFMDWGGFESPSLPSRTIEADGSFAVLDVEAGDYWLRVLAPGRSAGELHRQAITVVAEQVTHVEILIASGGIDGEVVAPEAGAAPLSGRLRLFKDAASVPDDIDAWEATGRIRHVRFQAGRFRVDDIAAGSYLVEISAGKDRASGTGRIDVTPGVEVRARLTAGPSKMGPPTGR